jgi:hypothetical protein
MGDQAGQPFDLGRLDRIAAKIDDACNSAHV